MAKHMGSSMLIAHIFVPMPNARMYNSVAAIYGGVSKFQQSKQLYQGCEIVIATPVRETW